MSGLGPICLPYLATYLLDTYGVQSTVFLFAALALNGFVCSLTYRPIYNFEKKNYHSANAADRQNDNNKGRGEGVREKLVKIDVEKSPSPTSTSREKTKESAHFTFLRNFVEYFDLGLLRDATYMNLSFGLTLISFAEFNFAMLTPIILADFLFANEEIAMAMSLCGLSDLVMRFLMPLVTSGSNLSNQTYFIIGLVGMCLGRLLLSFVRTVHYMWAIFFGLGISKAFRTVFWGLVLPSYLPLDRLAAGTGLQLVMSALFSLCIGPLIGK